MAETTTEQTGAGAGRLGGRRVVSGGTLGRWRGLLRGESPLWPAMSRFLFDFTSCMDAGRLKAVVAPLDVSLTRGDGRAAVRLRRLALERCGVTPCCHGFPRGDGSRLLLLEPSEMLLLAEWLGCLASAPALRRVVARAQVSRLSAELPHAYPAVFRREAFYQRWLERLRACGAESPLTGAEVQAQGMRVVSAVLSPLPEPLLRRLPLRFPESCADWFSPAPGWECQEGDVALLETVLRHEDKEGWTRCCC